MTDAPRRSMATFYVVIALVAVNLRDALTSLPTVLHDVQAATGATEVMLGALTTIPVLCMGAFAILAPILAARFGATRVVWSALALLAIAMGMRLWASHPLVLPVSVVLAGTGIALATGLVPGIIRGQAPDRIGAATSAWTTAMFIGAATAAALTVPLSELLGSWERALAFWAIPAVIGLVAWSIYERPFRTPVTGGMRLKVSELPWRDPTVWALTAWVAINAIVFYSSVAWLAPSFVDRGLTPSQAGLVFGFFSVVQIIGALTVPQAIHRTERPRVLLTSIVIVGVACLLAIALGPTPVAVVALVGYAVALAAGFTAGLALIPMTARDPQDAARLAAVVFTITYLFGAIGPIVCGAIVQATGSYTVVFVGLAVIGAAQAIPVAWLKRGAKTREPVPSRP